MKFFGKFEKDNQSKIYRTRTYIGFDDLVKIEKPNTTDVLGTIFMLNPGSSRPLNSDVNKPFENYTFKQYVELETDDTMNVLMDIFSALQKEKKYLSGIVEIKNLFNYRKSKLLSDDWIFMTDCIKKRG